MSEIERTWCSGCKFWGRERAHDDDMPLGSCHRYAPRLTKLQVLTYHDPDRPQVPGPVVNRGDWPWTTFDDWCGEFSARTTDKVGA